MVLNVQHTYRTYTVTTDRFMTALSSPFSPTVFDADT